MAGTYAPMATVTLSSATSSVVFSSIPSYYRDLIIVVRALGSTTNQPRFRFNADTGSNYHYVRMSGSGSATSSASGASQTSGFLSQISSFTTTVPMVVDFQILDYSSTDKETTTISRTGNGTNGNDVISNRWANTSIVNSITILTSTGDFASGSTFDLYGVIA